MGQMFSDEMRKLRTSTALSQKDFARRVGIAEGTIANVESGNRLLSTDNIDKVATALRLGPFRRKALFAARDADRASPPPARVDVMEDRLRSLEKRVAVLERERRATVTPLPAHRDPAELGAAAEGPAESRGTKPGRQRRAKPAPPPVDPDDFPT